MLSEFDKEILRAWSAVVSRGMLGNAREVAAYLGNGVALDEVQMRMAGLRAISQLPRETLFPAALS